MTKTKHSVLVVDDESSNILALTHILGPEYTVYAAKNGRNAIEAAETHLPDVILLDILMPEMDGYAVLSALKNSEKTQNIPVIFVTGLSGADDEQKGLALGASDYITKPFSPAIVKLRVRNQIQIVNQIRLILEKDFAEKYHSARVEFLLRMSHEMLTPMNAIIGIAQILKMSDALQETKNYLNDMDVASRHLLELINNLLDISGKKDGVFRLADSVFSFNAMVQDVVGGIRRSAEKKRQKLTIDIDSSLPKQLVGDPERLAQVITNLLTNAVKFTPEDGEIRLSACVMNEDNGTINLWVEVADNGIGLSKEQQSGVFDVFKQVDESITRRHDGIGLGLSISKRIVEMMDGKIWVESELGQGTKFIFTCKMRKG